MWSYQLSRLSLICAADGITTPALRCLGLLARWNSSARTRSISQVHCAKLSIARRSKSSSSGASLLPLIFLVARVNTHTRTDTRARTRDDPFLRLKKSAGGGKAMPDASRDELRAKLREHSEKRTGGGGAAAQQLARQAQRPDGRASTWGSTTPRFVRRPRSPSAHKPFCHALADAAPSGPQKSNEPVSTAPSSSAATPNDDDDDEEAPPPLPVPPSATPPAAAAQRAQDRAQL